MGAEIARLRFKPGDPTKRLAHPHGFLLAKAIPWEIQENIEGVKRKI
jgi:hypothetical protein